MKKDNPDYFSHALRRSYNSSVSKGRHQVKKICPNCGREHHAATDMCWICKSQRGKDYVIVFNTPQEQEMYDNKTERIRHEEKILKRKGYDPSRVSAYTADRILRK